MAANAALLDELMGRNRNLTPDEQKLQAVHFDHRDVCRYYLCGFCPHELFKNTRVDIGPCDKIHDDELVQEYKKSDRFKRCGYEEEFAKFVGSLVSDIDKRIKRGHERLKLNNTPAAPSPQEGKEQQIGLLTERINDMLKQAEQLGCEGKVDESQGVLKLVEQLKLERRQMEEEVSPLTDLKEMEVCGICGAFQVKGDAPSRVEEHINGKQHIGYTKLRSFLQDIEDERKEREEERSKQSRSREESRRHDERRSRDDYSDDRRRYRDDYDRHGRDRRRSRSRERRRERNSERSGRYESERYRRSRSRERRREEPRGGRRNGYDHYH